MACPLICFFAERLLHAYLFYIRPFPELWLQTWFFQFQPQFTQKIITGLRLKDVLYTKPCFAQKPCFTPKKILLGAGLQDSSFHGGRGTRRRRLNFRLAVGQGSRGQWPSGETTGLDCLVLASLEHKQKP